MAETRRILSWKLLRWMFYLSVIAFVILFALAATYWYQKSREVPDPAQLAEWEPDVISRVHAGDGTLIAEFAREHRVYIPFEAVPENVIWAFVSAEDKKFFQHDGIDYLGMARGISRTVWNKVRGKSGMQGGSTISQQVAKNMLLSRDQTIERKVKEAIVTRRMEKTFSKEKIMEFYLNVIFLGRNSYGVGSASLNYFNKALPELDLAEAATLAALAQRPGAVNPDTNPERLVVRRNWVLGRMVANGYITQDQADEAIAQPLTTGRRLRGAEYEATAYFVEELRRDLIETYDEETLYTGGLSIRSTIDTGLQLAAMDALRTGLVNYDRRHGYRGPFAQIEVGPEAVQQLAELQAPSGAGDWERALVSAVGPETVELTLVDGETIKLEPDDTAWARDTFTSVEGNRGLTLGDVVLTDVTRVPAEAVSPAVNRASTDVEEAGIDDPETSDVGRPDEPVMIPEGFASLRQIPEVEGALIALDPQTGRVLAMAGGFSFWKSQYNRATQAVRQPGSTFKPFVYAAALQNGYTPASKVLDAPFVEYDVSTDEYWKPSNYEAGRFFGLSTMRLGLEKSRNAMTVRMAQDIGMKPIVTLANKMGVYETPPPEYLSVALGAAETTPLAMVEGYAAFVNGGKRVKATFIDRVQDRHGRTLYAYDERACEGCDAEAWDGGPPPAIPDERDQVLDPVTSYQMVHLLEGVVQRGTGRRALAVGKPLAGKTGTTNDYIDAWFVGFSPNLVVGIWVGFDEPRSLGSGEAGGSVAAPIFTDFMSVALADEPAVPFRIPPGVRLVEIDARTGELPNYGTDVRILEAFRPGTEPGVNFSTSENTSLFGQETSVGSTSGQDSRDGALDPEGDDAPLPVDEVVDTSLADGEW